MNLLSKSQADPSARLFIALPISPEVLSSLEHLIRTLNSQFPPETVRWTRPEQIHLSLKFLGQVPRETIAPLQSALREACRGIPPISLRAETVGAFPNSRNPRVIWAGLQGDLELLKNLHQKVEAKTSPFSAKNENRPFRPHLTLGRVREGGRTRLEFAPAQHESVFGAWTARETVLMESKLSPRGATYMTLCRIPLKEDPRTILF
jgi:RNA 2',3'-cyclic 3'-phosphodiesterase